MKSVDEIIKIVRREAVKKITIPKSIKYNVRIDYINGKIVIVKLKGRFTNE